MKVAKEWPTEAFAALLPLFMGGLAIYFQQGSGGLDAARKWVSDGILMPPAAVLCMSLYVYIQRAAEGATSRGRVSLMTLPTILVLLCSVLLFAASVQPPNERGLSEWQLFWWNSALYLFVLIGCVIVSIGSRDGGE